MSDLNDRLQQARDRIAQSLLPKVADASKAASESRLDTAPKGSNLREHIANGGIVTNNLVNYFNDDAVAKTIKAREELAAQQNDYVGISTANLRSSNPFVSAAANTANLVGGAVGTLAQWANTAAGDEFTAQAIALEAGTPPQMIEAYNTFNKIRSQKQTLAEEHGILLDMLRNKQGDPVAVKKKLAEVEATYKGIVVDPNVEAALSTQIGDETYLDRLDRSQELRHKGVRVQAGSGEGILPAMNVSDFSNPYFKKPLEEAATSSQFVKDTNKEADAAFDRGDYLEGIGKKALSFGAVVGNVLKEAPSNPMGVLQYTAESAPYFALPGVGTAAIVNQTAVEGRNKFEQRTGNALPTTGENLAMLGTDVLYGALNYLGDKGINNAARGITAGVGRTNTQILRDAATGTGQSTISAVGKEAAAEGAQTYLEDSGQNLSTYFNPETVGLGTAIGGLSAGIVSGPGAVVSGAKQASLDRFMNTEEGKAIADQMELAKVPTEELSDITSPKYNPHEVIRRTTNSVKGEDSVATIKETNLAELDKIGAIVDSLDGAIADAESAQAEYVKTSAMLDQLEANDVDGSKAGMIAAVRSTLDESNAQNLSVGYEENIKQLQAKKAKADELYLSVREEIIKSNAYLDSLDFVDGVAVNGKPKAASEDTVTNDYISEASGREAARLAQEPDNDYTEEEVSRLRTFSDAVAAANRRKNLNVVGEDIAQGSGKGASKRFKGLGSYLVDAANLVKSGNDRAKKALLNTLTKFSENHESKVAAVKQAFADAQGTDVTIVGKDATTGKWNILDTVSAEDYKANYEKTLAKTGSLGIHSGSNANGFISSMEQESKDIKAVLASVEDTLTTGKLPVHVIAAQGKPKTTESSKGTTKSSTTSKEEKRNPQMEAAYKDVFDKPIGEWDESDFSTIGAQAYDTGSTISTPEEAVKANSFSQKMTKKIIADGIAKNRSTADIMQDVMFVAYSSDFAMKQSGVDALHAYINMRKGLVTEAENKLKGKSTPATKPTAKAPTAPVELDDEQPVNDALDNLKSLIDSSLSLDTLGKETLDSVEESLKNRLAVGIFSKAEYDKGMESVATLRKHLVTKAENKLKGKNTPATKPTAKAPVESKPVLPVIPQEAVENEEVDAAVATARQSVRDLLIKLNFKFVDSPDVNLSDIERIASKYLTEGTSNDDPAYLKDAAKALSYAIYFELGLPQGHAASRAWLEASLLSWLTDGKVPKLHLNVWAKTLEIFDRIIAAFSSKEFKAIEFRLESTLNKIATGADFSFKPKEGFAKLSFQNEMNNNPLAVETIKTLIKSGIKFSLTGSIAFADQVPVYRKTGKPLHDMDYLFAPEDVDAALELFKNGDPDVWGDTFKMYEFHPSGIKTIGIAVVPKGYVIKNAKSFWNVVKKAPQRSYDVHDVVTGKKVGSYFFLRGVREEFVGIAGITVDIIGNDKQSTVKQEFKDSDGKGYTIDVSSYVGGFVSKLGMLRYKDITDFVAVVPPEQAAQATKAPAGKPKETKPTASTPEPVLKTGESSTRVTPKGYTEVITQLDVYTQEVNVTAKDGMVTTHVTRTTYPDIVSTKVDVGGKKVTVKKSVLIERNLKKGGEVSKVFVFSEDGVIPKKQVLNDLETDADIVNNLAKQDGGKQLYTPAYSDERANTGKGTKATTPKTMNIYYGSNENPHLSNLAPRKFIYDGKEYYSVEHAYQTLKSGKFNPVTYKKYKQGQGGKISGGSEVRTDMGWNIGLMKELIQASFDNNPMDAQVLMDTGDAVFTHNQDKGVWNKVFPALLTEVRSNLTNGVKVPKTHFIDYSGDTTTNTEVDVNALLDEANAASFEEEYDNQADIIESELRGEPTPTEAEPSTPEPTVEDTLTAKLEKAKEDALNELEDLFKEAGKGLKQNADPVLITKIMAATVKLTGIYFALGTIKFADWAKAILTDLKKRGVDPEDVKPLLKQAYLATAASSEVKDEILDQMDDAKTVRAFDIDSLLLGSKDTKEVPKGNGEIKLNEGQEKAFSEIMTFLENTDPSVNTHTLIGAAGTGKTTIVNSILKALREAGSVYGTVVLTSPTHRANTVTMSKNKSEKVQTLHKLLNLLPWIDLDKLSDYDSSKVTFKRGDSEDDTGFPSSGLVIVDESSMIGDDLYDFLIKSLDANPGVKILFLGDAAQLRPVSKKNKNGERVGIKDDAKDSKALTESNSVSILTKVERAENSALLGESVYLRNGKGNFSDTNNMTDSNGVVFLNEKKTFIDKVVDMFKSKEFLKDPLLVRVVAFRNEVIKDLNNRIREGIYGKNPPDYVVGELLLGYNAYGKANPGGILPIANGVDYIIDKIGPTESKEILGVSVLTAEITFHDVFGLAKSKKLRFILPSNTEATWTALGLAGDKFLTHDANGKFIPERDTRARYKRKKPFEEVLGEYVFPRDIGVMEKKKGDTKEKLRPIHNQTINYGYAHTIHKSQGGTYSYVFVEGRDIDSPDADLNKRLRYVGTTRAKKGAFIYVGPGVAIDTSKPVTYLSFTPAPERDKQASTQVKIESAIINREGVQELYDSIPELAEIGTVEEYSQYLDSVFPNSDIKDIVYHGTDVSKDDVTFKSGRGGIFLASTPTYASYFSENDNAYLALINFQNVYHAKGLTDDIDINAINTLQARGYDSVIGKGGISKMQKHKDDLEFIAFNSKQIHILGSKQDIDGFKKFTVTTPEPVKQIPVETKLEVALQGYTNHSGGAKGYDAEWDIIGAEFGFNNNNHYLLPVDGDVADPRLKAKGVKPVDATKDIGQVAATGQATGEAQVAVTEAERLMGRIAPNHTTRNTKKIRNYAQVKNADGIFAIGSLIPKGTEITIAQGKETRTALVPQVNGGTSVAVQLGIMMGKPTYVFNQVENDTYAEGWHKWDAAKEDFVPTGIPVLTKNFAGVGTSSNTTEQGKQAIRDVYQRTFHKDATETQTINPEYRGKVILAHAGTGKSFATKSNPDIVDGDVLYYQATNTIIDKYNKANGENVPKIKDVTGTRGVFDAWGEYGDKAAIQALEVLKVNNKNVVGELSKVTPADVAKWKKSLLGGDSDTKAIATLEKYLVSKTEIDSRKAEAIRRRNEIYQEYANQARALADSGKTVLSSSIRPELVAVADIVIAQNDVNFIAKNLTSSERVNQNSEVDLGKIQKKIDKAIRVEGELGNKGKRITLKNLGDKQFISDLLFGSDEVIAESVIDEGVSVHGKPKLMSKPIREIDNELPVGGMSVFTGAANVTPRERQAAQAKIINSPNTTETKVVAPIKRKDGSTTPGRTTKIEISGLQKANLVVASFYQKAKSNSVVVAIKDFFTTHFSNDTSANEFLDKFLGRPATPEELNLIRVFRDFHTKRIQPNVRSLLTGYAQLGDFKLTDYLTYLFPDEANPSLDENIVTAISAAAFSFLLEKSGKFTHAEEDVAELLGLDEKTPIPHVVMRRYQNVGSSRAAIVSYLGRSIFESLSLRVQQDATEERKQRMINAFGSLAYNIMAKEGLLQVTEVLNSVVAGDIARVTGQTTDHTVKNDETLKGDHVRGFTTYARVAYDTKTKKSKRGDWLYENNAKLRPDIQEYKDAARGVSSVLNNLFGITNVDTAPLFKEPKGLNQESTDQLGTQVPSALKDNTEQMMKKKYVPNGDTYKAMLHLRDNNTEALEAMIGVVSDEDIAKMHVTQRSSVISTNEGLRRSLENGLAFVSSVPTTEGQYAPIYLPMKVWVLNRVGVTSNLFNEQGDKVHRALTVMSQHVQTIAATQPLVNGEISLVGRALLGAAAYMEEITLSIGKVAVDKTAASVYLPALMEYLSLDRVSSAIASYGKLQDGTATMEDITAVRDLVIEFGGGAMSLASVNVLYQLSTIKDGKATLKTEGEVTTNVAIGSDGVTNGMALSMLVYGIGRPRNKQGATVNSLHNAAGYFYVGDKQETLMAYRSSGADDLYQQLARIQKDLWNTLVTNNRNPVEQAKHAALAFFDPKFGERAGAKVGLVPFVYGSGFTSIKAAQSRAFISSIYATMAKLASSNGGNPTTASIVEFDTHLSALLGKPETFLTNAVLAAREGLTVKEELIKAKVDAILETELTRNMIDKITEVESGIRGTITQNAMKVMSGDLIAARGRVNNLASLGFDIFKGLFDFTRDETLKNLESQGLTKYRVAQNGDRITLEGLTVKQMDRLMADLNKYGPVVVSVAGTYSTNPVESAHAMYIVTKVPQTAELPVSKLHIKTQFDIKHTPNSATVPTFSNFESPLYTITIEYRGPANNASIVQAMDAWVTTQVSSKFDALNHHDENASGVTEAVAMAQFQNKVLFDAALQYGVYKEVLRGSLFRPLRGIIKYGESSTGKETDASSELARRNFAVELSKGTFSSLKQYADENFNIKNKTSYSDLLKAIVTAMYDVEVNKVSALKGLSAISQYSLEGGEYKITPRDKQAIEDKIAALKEELALDLEVATKLGKDLDKLYFSTITTPKAQAKPEVVRTIGSNGRVTQRSTKKIKFRRAGDQSNILNPVYLGNDFLVVNDGIVDVAASIANIDFSGTYMDSALGKAMLKLILSSLPKGLTVQYLTPDNVTPDMAKALVNPNAKDSAVDKLSRGDSWYYNNNIVIAVDGRGHAVSLIHELVHAVTSATVGIGGDPNTIDAFTRLSDRLKEYAADNAASISPHTLKKIEYATGKLSEFITVMLTEQDVFELARKIPTSLKTRTRSANTKGMATLLKDFLTVIADYFRSKVNAAKDSLNDMESLLESTLVIAMDAMQLNKTYFDSGTSEDFEGELDNDLDNKKADAVRLVTEFRAQEVFEALPSSGDLEADQRLSALMLSIIDSTYTPISNSRANTTYTPNEVWGKAISEGRTPYGTGAIAAGFELSQRELFAIEALEVTVKGVIDSGIVSPAYKELLKVFDTAKTVLSAKDFHKGDWSKATEHQKEVAEAKHRYLFNIAQSANGRSDFMSKFVAMALGSHEVHALLTFSEKKAKAKDSTLLSKIEAMYEHALRWVSGYLTNTSTYQQAKNKLPILVRNLVDIDHKKRDQAVGNVFDKLNVGVGKLDKFIKERGKKLDASLTKLVDGTKYPRIAGVTKTAGIIAGGRAMDLLDLAQQYRDLANPGKPLGWKAEILNEMATPSKAKQAVLRLLRRYTLIQTGRKNHSSTTVEALLESFADGGMKLSKSDKEALTYGVLRTDMQVLFSQYGRIGLRRLLSSPQFLDQRIQELEVDVTDPLHRVRVKDLAFYMTTGETNDMLAENALSIARNVGMQTVMKESEVDPDYLSKLDELISLRALEYMDTHHKDSLIKIMDIENARTEGSANGVETLMRYHKRIQEDAKDALYEGNTTAFVKGYIPDITDPHREIKVVTTEAERKQMKDMGYTFVRAYRSHPSEPGGGTRYVYVTEASSKTRYVSGAVSMTGKVKNGTSIFANSDLSYVGEHNVIRRETDLARERILNINPSSYDPRVDGTRGVAPTYSNGGTIIDFRYVHSHATKDSLLSRNNNFAKVLGAFAGSNFDKVSTSDHNKAVIDVITADYQENYTRYPRSFVEVGPDSPDPRVRAMYFMLPEDTRNYVQSIWGKGTPMYIRNTLLLPLFGTSKYTIGLAFDKNPELRNLPERIITGVFSAVFKDTAKLRALQAETLNQSLVSWYKSTVVIRNLTTLMGNQASNTGILLAMKVPATDIYRNSVLAYRAGMDYMSDTRELIRAQNAMNTGIGNAAVHLQTIRKHSDSLARNPLKEFLDAGMLTTIVEDVSLEINDYEYKSRLEQKIDDQLDKLNPTIRKIGATLLVAPSTELYQKLATLTQLSDFTAKYVLYSHMRNKSKEKLSHEDALALADTIFINYDVPTSMELQYGNDMGFLMFTKYTLRVQRAMAYLIKNHKGGLFAQSLLANTLGMPAATIPLFINQLGNPLQPGGLGAVGALNQPLPIKMLLGGIN